MLRRIVPAEHGPGARVVAELQPDRGPARDEPAPRDCGAALEHRPRPLLRLFVASGAEVDEERVGVVGAREGAERPDGGRDGDLPGSGGEHVPYSTVWNMPAPTRTPRTSWIEAGLRALAAGGPDAVRIEPLAAALGVTRGGFYWHFENRAAFLGALLDSWERRSTDAVLERVEREGGDPRDKVVRAGLLTFSRDLLPIDLAVRDWARRDPAVADRLRRVDDRRMDYLRALIGALHPDPGDVEARALLAFSLAIGDHFIAAGHGGRSRAEVLELAMRRVLG